MESNLTPNTQYKQVTVDVPEERVAEFHAFFGRFLAAREGRGYGRRGRHLGHRHHGKRCAGERGEGREYAEGRAHTEGPAPAEQPQPTVETTEL